MNPFMIEQGAVTGVDRESAELRFLRGLCQGKAEQAAKMLGEARQFGGLPIVDAPQGRYEGSREILAFAKHWLKDFDAAAAELQPVTQTKAGGRRASEVLVHFQRAGGKVSIPMCIMGDLRTDGGLDAVRIYFYYGWVPGFSAYRRIIFAAEHAEPAPYSLMTGSVRKYFELLHSHADLQQRVEAITALTTPDADFGGYRPDWVEPADAGHQAIRQHYRGICADAPDGYQVRAQTITDDGIRCVVEWTLVVTEKGFAAGRVPQSGVAIYERDPASGLLCGIRICDNVGKEDGIFLQELPEKIRAKVASYRNRG